MSVQEEPPLEQSFFHEPEHMWWTSSRSEPPHLFPQGFLGMNESLLGAHWQRFPSRSRVCSLA